MWTIFIRSLHTENDHPRVLTYINIRLIRLYFSFRKDICNHRDINLVYFFNCSIICFLINVYSDDQQSTLKNTEVNLNNIIIIIGDFNIRDTDWDSLYLYHLIYIDVLSKITDSFNIELLSPVIQVLT